MKCEAKDGKCSDGGKVVARIYCDGLRMNVCEYHFNGHKECAIKFKVIERYYNIEDLKAA